MPGAALGGLGRNGVDGVMQRHVLGVSRVADMRSSRFCRPPITRQYEVHAEDIVSSR